MTAESSYLKMKSLGFLGGQEREHPLSGAPGASPSTPTTLAAGHRMLLTSFSFFLFLKGNIAHLNILKMHFIWDIRIKNLNLTWAVEALIVVAV